MIIGIDGNEANVKNRFGVGEYAYQLLRKFYDYHSRADEVKNRFRIYLKNEVVSTMPSEDAQWRYRVVQPSPLWTQWRLPLDLHFHQPKPDVFFTPTHYAPRFCPVPSVVSIMDTSYIYFPETFKQGDLYKLKNWTAYSVKQAKKVLTISNSSKNDIIKAYNIPADRVVVTYPGIKDTVSFEPRVYGMNQLKAKYGISGHFILFVGTLQPRKNIVRLIEAFSKVRSMNQAFDKSSGQMEAGSMDLELVIIGKKGWLYEEILAAPEKFGVKERVKFLHSVDDEELQVFYKHAVCYVLPSLYEGFGLPVLEAMQYKCPVITSNVSSLPEAGGDAALYVDPEDTDDIAEKILKLIKDEKLRKELVEKGKEQVKKFSWEKTAKETLKVLEEVANSNK